MKTTFMKRWIVGTPLSLAQARHERLSKTIETHALIPLYAVGVFISFTLSESGMVRHWLLDGGAGWRWRLAINGLGAVVTGVVAVVIAVTKFVHGAWIIVLLIPLMVLAFRAVHRHYERVADMAGRSGA
jgi:hypothetical protein